MSFRGNPEFATHCVVMSRNVLKTEAQSLFGGFKYGGRKPRMYIMSITDGRRDL
jgi:hypothetical protein